ncbi:glycosyltransferase family 4 protein [Trueperella pecoris]|uniref:Glycosyltransferase family 4 protein n=1 Tax=Trueperella pecoris TaxID=2733571 RepID=A0A7M1QVL6_9ACTO|nr:glycosyltransferase family 4 protein [Trueperella pecoris]QOR45197.1 glycosyltransferase family 4 protein [Trueperella pecoris]QTG75102.1 glycosyltransferase family 4 protein [Trueperella pecoris]
MKIAIITLDTFGQRMAGPAIRVWEMATVLSSDHEVEVFTFGAVEREGETFSLRRTRVEDFRRELGQPDVVIMQGYLIKTFPWLANGNFKLVVDLYDPFHIESLQVERFHPMDERIRALDHSLAELNSQVRGGDFFLCASNKQRDLWLGHLAALGRVNPLTYDDDPQLRRLIDVGSFGIQSTPPSKTRPAIRGIIPGIAHDDKVIVWGGGVYNWFDPLTVIRAVDRVRETVPNIRLLFMGAKHPNPDVPEMQMLRDARALSDEMGLTGKHVFFNEEWVEYSDRHNYLLEADIAVSAHLPGLETDFSFRTRMLDYLWAGLPIVATEGDYFAELIADRGLGRTVPSQNVEAMSQAFCALLSDDVGCAACAERVSDVAREFHWDKALAALVAYCRDPWEAADRKLGRREEGTNLIQPTSPSVLVRKALRLAHEHGIRKTIAQGRRYLARNRKRFTRF